jgi:ketosteroid isomerase-like protein
VILHGVSQESIEFVRSRLEEFIRTGDFHSEDFDEGFEFDNSNAMIDADTYRGPAGLREYYALLRQMWEQFRFEPQEYIDAANGHVVVPMRLIAVGRDGVETVAHSAVVYTVRDGKLARAKAFQSKGDALKADR